MKLYQIKWPGAMPKAMELDGKPVLIPVEGQSSGLHLKKVPLGIRVTCGEEDSDNGSCIAMISVAGIHSKNQHYDIYNAQGVDELMRARTFDHKTVLLLTIEAGGQFQLEDDKGLSQYRWDGKAWEMDVAVREE